MADPIVSAEFRARAMARLAQSGPSLAQVLGIEPPAPVAGEALKEPALREARTLESLADFIERATSAARLMGAATEEAPNESEGGADHSDAPKRGRPRKAG